MTLRQLNFRWTALSALLVTVSLALIAGCHGAEPSSPSPSPSPPAVASSRSSNAPEAQNQNDPPLVQAAKKGDTAAVESLLKDKSTRVDETDSHGNTALLHAAGDDDRAQGGSHSEPTVTAIVRLLLSRHANPNAASEDGTTPLFAAITRHHFVGGPVDLPGIADARLWKAKLLIAAGANVSAHTKADTQNESVDHLKPGATPLMAAAQEQRADPRMTDLLLSHGADVNATDQGGNTALMRAAKFGNPTIVKILIDHHANVNARSSTGDTALKEAQRSKSRPFAESVALLTKAGETE